MAEIADIASAEAAWFGSRQGKAAHQAAWLELHEMGLHQHVDATQLGRLLYAAHLAGEQDDELMPDEPPSGHLHSWHVHAIQPHSPFAVIGKPVPHTIVLLRCTECGEPDSLMLAGEWTLGDLLSPAARVTDPERR